MRPNLFSKAFTPYNALIFGILALCLAGCSSYNSAGSEKMFNEKQNSALTGYFVLPQLVTPPAEIQSIQLYSGNDASTPPIINLSGNNTLTLEFDDLRSSVRQFKISISHRNQYWEKSPIPAIVYMGSFFEAYFGDGRKSFVQNPAYYHYTYQFPDERLKITKSGNYMLSVFDYDSNELLFRLPFFVSENKGTLATRVETVFAQRTDGRAVAQPFSEYRYPTFVQQPQFDLSFLYVQNQFWGRARKSEHYDTATPGIVNFHLSRDESFIADYEFNLLDIQKFEADGRQIIDIAPGKTPPEILLRRDIQQFNSRPSPYPSPVGIPRDDRQAQYGSVTFSFETATSIAEEEQLYLVGDFNNWMIDQKYRMRFDSTAALWRGQALIKQGIYSYKYILMRNKQIDDLLLDQVFTQSRQQYITFVYFRDPQRNFDRLLKVDITHQ